MIQIAMAVDRLSEFLNALLGFRGLSPRVRGHHATARPSCRVPRSIPACAGASLSAERPVTRHWVYPRVCGGIDLTGVMVDVHLGLSPRVRGHLAVIVHRDPPRRSIPACAGPPIALSCRPLPRQVYPRVCGATYPTGNAFQYL